jgi:phage/plasmid-like protein (TIGR03299 family)
MTPNIDVYERLFIIGKRIQEGRDTYAGRQDAWHKMGSVTGEFSSWKELYTKAKADFPVVKRQLEFHGVKINSWGTFRVDRSKICDSSFQVENDLWLTFFNNVGEDYSVLHHSTGFELLDELVGQVDGAHYETMGVLDYGRLVWGQVDPNLDIRVGDDITKVYLTFHTSHDGSKAYDIFETGTREVCRNIFRLGALKKLAATLRVKHTKNAAKRIQNLKAEIAEIRDTAMSMQQRLNFLAGKRVTRESLDAIMLRLFPVKKDENGEDQESTRRKNILADILAVYDDNDGNAFPEQKGTAYNLLNSITNYVDHSRSTKNNQRSESAMFGSGDKLKNQAMEVITLAARDMPNRTMGTSYQVDSFSDLGLNVGGK